MDAALLARAHADGLAVLHIADGVGLGVLQGDEGEEHIVLGLLGQVFVLGDDVLEHLLADIQAVVSLFEGDAEDIAALDGGGS